jgi:hypothetical protein
LPRDDVKILVAVQVGKFDIMCSHIADHMHPPVAASDVEILKPDEPFVCVPIGDDDVHITVTVHIAYFRVRAPAVVTGADRMPGPVGVFIPEQFASSSGDYEVRETIAVDVADCFDVHVLRPRGINHHMPK